MCIPRTGVCPAPRCVSPGQVCVPRTGVPLTSSAPHRAGQVLHLFALTLRTHCVLTGTLAHWRLCDLTGVAAQGASIFRALWGPRCRTATGQPLWPSGPDPAEVSPVPRELPRKLERRCRPSRADAAPGITVGLNSFSFWRPSSASPAGRGVVAVRQNLRPAPEARRFCGFEEPARAVACSRPCCGRGRDFEVQALGGRFRRSGTELSLLLGDLPDS